MMSSLRLSLLAAAALIAPGVAHAQLVSVDATVLADLDTRVTVNSGRIDALSEQVAATATTVAGLQADAVIAANAAAALDTRVAANADATVALHARVAANTDATAAVDAKVGQTSVKLAALDTQVLAATDATVTLEGRTTTLEGQVGNLVAGATDTAGRLVAVTTQAAGTATTVGELVPTVAKNTSDIAALTPRVAQNAADITDVDARATARLSAVGARVTLNDQRDDAQDATLSDHDRRIRVAQTTADTARIDSATLRSDVDAGRAGMVRQAGPSAPVTVAAASGGTSVAFNGTDGDRRLTGVAAGVASNDAATVGQMNASAAETLAAANGYTDRSIASALAANDTRVERMIAGNNRLLHADIDSSAAGSAALASLPQSIVPGSGMLGASVGGKGNQVAMALGLSKAFNAPHVPVLRAGAAIDTRTGDAVYNAAVGIHF